MARSVFWLGLVYSSMPLDFGSLVSDRAAELNPLAACAQCPSGECGRRLEGLRRTLTAAAAVGAPPPRRPVQSRAS